MSNQDSNPQWTTPMKNFSSTFRHRSPTAFRFFRKHFTLPSESTISRHLSYTVNTPGIQQSIISAVKHLSSRINDIDRDFVLVWDEISLHTHYHYNHRKDIIEGFADYGHLKRRPVEATVALVYFIRSIKGLWKFPLCYLFANNSTPSEIMHTYLLSIIELLHQNGIRIRITVCDMGPNNQSLLNNILKVTPENPFFYHTLESGEKVKVFVSWDTPHLIKCLRNSFINYNIKFAPNKIAHWSDITSFYKEDSKRCPRLCPKLTDSHFNLTNFTKQRVKYATQVLSHSTSAAMLTHISLGNASSPSYVHTAEFIDIIDSIFDCLNSSSLSNRHGKPYSTAIQLKNTPHLFLMNHRKFIKELEYYSGNKKVRDPPYKNGLLLSINSILQLFSDLSSSKVKHDHLLTRHIQQDFVEASFGIMREKAGCSSTLTVQQFTSAFKSLLVHNFASASTKTNCEWDDDCLLSYIFNSRTFNSNSQSSVSNVHNINLMTIPSEHHQLFDDIITKNSNSYISGYILRRIFTSVECNSCQSALIETSNIIFREDTVFINFKKYNENSHLIIPSTKTLETVTSIINLINEHFEKLIFHSLIKKELMDIIHKNIDFSFIPLCHRENLSQNITSLLCCIFIRFHVRLKNLKISNNTKDKGRHKLQKVSHN